VDSSQGKAQKATLYILKDGAALINSLTKLKSSRWYLKREYQKIYSLSPADRGNVVKILLTRRFNFAI